MAVDTASLFASVIQEHLELRRRNAALEHEMPLERYMPDDPFENHPLFKTEEQARIEDTMDGNQSIVDEPTSLDWGSADTVFPEAPVPAAAPAPAADPCARTAPEAGGRCPERRGATGRRARRGHGRRPLVALARLRLGRLAPGGGSRRLSPPHRWIR